MLRVAYLIQQFPPEVGAGAARVAELGSRWLERGVEVTAITAMPNRPEGRIHKAYRKRLFLEESWSGIRTLRSWLYASPKHGFGRTVLNNVTFMVSGAIHALLRVKNCDVMIASSPPLFPHISGCVVSAFKRIPLVLEIRDLWPDYIVDMGVLKRDSLAARLLFRMEKALLRRAVGIVVVTESFKRRLIEKGIPADRIHVIPNGVDISRYYATREAPPTGALVRDAGAVLVGYLGNMGAGQGLTAVVEAAGILATEAPSVQFVMVGDGPDKRNVLTRIEELGLTNLSCHPPIPKEATRAFYNSCDINLVPLANIPVFQETVPSKLFEILACERTVVASLAGEGARIVHESGGGVVVSPENPRAIADGIMKLIACSLEDRVSMGKQAREFVAREFNRDELAVRYLKLLQDVGGKCDERATATGRGPS